EHGLDEMDKRILEVIGQNYNGGPVGANTIAIAIGEERQTLEEVHEPFLIQEGYLQRTPQGRVLTSKAWQLLGIERKQGELY
ncbi:MAG: Holliday junction branch migration DNA helicase RuvB, partial [Puniceicoccales bacterium]|nr:Holliday junction branch migration DNA helicase RuvB [Puniceicoccales bacterium]